jgi:metal-responsive CopG/Arc/MetJ family transcriptional regulator
MNTKSKVRVTIDLTKDRFDQLESLEKKVGAASKVEVIRDALRLYEFIASKKAEGYEFAVCKNGEMIVVELLITTHTV